MPGVMDIANKAVRWRTSTGRLVLAGAVVVSAVLVLAQSAVASPVPRISAIGWHLQSPPVPSGAIASDLSDVSCTSAGACTAVGSDESSGSVFSRKSGTARAGRSRAPPSPAGPRAPSSTAWHARLAARASLWATTSPVAPRCLRRLGWHQLGHPEHAQPQRGSDSFAPQSAGTSTARERTSFWRPSTPSYAAPGA
jgi:hypothetical protein